MESIANKLRAIADDIESDTSDVEKRAALVENFERYDGKLIRVRLLEWVTPSGQLITIKCDPPVLARITGLASVQVLERYAIGSWLVSLVEARTDVRDVPGLFVDGLASDDTDDNIPRDHWAPVETDVAEEEHAYSSPLTPTSRWLDEDYPDSGWFEGDDLSRLQAQGTPIDFIDLGMTDTERE